MPKLSASKGKYGKVQVERRSDDGGLECRVAYAFADSRQFRKAAAELGCGAEALTGLVDAFQRDGRADDLVLPGREAAQAGREVSCAVRGRLTAAESAVRLPPGQPLDALRGALSAACPWPEPLIEWGSAEHLAALDVDFHDAEYGRRPQWPALAPLAMSLEPRPACAWSTHGRGLRLIYESAPEFRADELAAVAALSVKRLRPAAGVEVKCGTRHPSYPVGDRQCGPVAWMAQTSDVGALRAWVGKREASDEQVAEWLEERGWVVGQRYPHSSCPVDPQEDGGRDPVSVRDYGVFCHACAGRGVSVGHRVAGWFPYSALCGTGVAGPVRACLDNLAHWEHARFVLAEVLGLEGEVARLAYGAALRLRHGADPRIAAAMAGGGNFVRFQRRWATLGGETYTKDVCPILARLPSCQYVDAEGDVKVSEERVARLNQPIDLGSLGYPALTPIWGMRVYSHALPLRDPSVVPLVVQTRELAHPSMEPFRPRYLRRERREYSEEEAWQVLEDVFPGVSRSAVRLLIAARGCSEGEVGMPPMVFISGPTSSAKSSTVVLAAAMCGDSNHSVVWSSNLERVRQALLESKENGSFVTFNEMLKDGKNAGQSMLGTMDFLLNLTPDSLSHKLYVGPVLLGGLPVCVWTDTEVPYELKQDAQLARRLTHVHLPRKVDWRSTLRRHGLSQVRLLRTISPSFASAANAIVSGVIDEFFQYPQTFDEVAEQLGFSTLASSSEAVAGQDALCDLFKAVCAAPPLSGSDAKRWTGRGWKLVNRDQECDLTTAWERVADEGWATSRRCSEVDWGGLLGIDLPIALEARAHGNRRVAVRFVHHQTRKTYLVNGELHGKLELGPGPGGVGADRLGDAEPGGSDFSWLQGLPAGFLDSFVEPGRPAA